ncbi:MAG: F420-nonreducing hydrogenase [Promethearchaeati archaeon SRVP18_Atabeyarchaeia-1]
MVQAKSVIFVQLSSCWGCHQSLIDLYEKLVDILPALNIKYWPAVVDFKEKDLEGLPDRGIDAGFVEGTTRTENDIRLLRLARSKSKLLVSYGTCSTYGGVYALANLSTRDELLRRKYYEAESLSNKGVPSDNLPEITSSIKRNDENVRFDLYLPGCPPTSDNIAAAVTALIEGKPIKVYEKTVCDECERNKEEKKSVKRYKRRFEGKTDPVKCLLNEGYLCLGPGTRAGCGAQCPTNANLPCDGCYGPPPGVTDQGAKLLSAIASIADMPPEELDREIADPLGQFYRFTFAYGLIKKSVRTYIDEKNKGITKKKTEEG